MTAGPLSKDTLQWAELIELFPDPAAIFDKDGALDLTNAAFRRAFAQIEQFLASGTSWQIFLAEVSRKGVLSSQACNELRLIEENHLQRGGVAPTVASHLADGSHAELTLAAL
ncbi:MAG: hypothetical protein AAF732_22615, partial [Pseudomonadota bacterium]